MPFRYLLLVLDGSRQVETILPGISDRTGLAAVYQNERFVLLTNDPGEVLALPAGDGLILGKLFHRHGFPAQVREFPPGAATKVMASTGRELVERYWGSYVAVLAIPDGATTVLRDPSGGLPCYHASFEGGVAFTSDGPILVNAGLLRPSIDWRMLGRALLFHHLPERQMAIAGIAQLFPGCALSMRGALGVHLQYWSPWDHTWPGGRERSEPCEEVLKRAISMTIAAWRSCFDRPLVGLSGGLDSSIVATCLAMGAAKPSCVTLVTDNPLGDERRYAQAVCDAIGSELMDLPFEQGAIDFDKSVSAGVPAPCGKLHEQAYNRSIRQAVAQFGADAFFAGAGGDNVFYMTHSARPLVDQYDAQGLSSKLVATLNDIAAITGASFWQVAREGLRLTHAREDQIGWAPNTDYLASGFVEAEATAPIQHPWFYPDHALQADQGRTSRDGKTRTLHFGALSQPEEAHRRLIRLSACRLIFYRACAWSPCRREDRSGTSTRLSSCVRAHPNARLGRRRGARRCSRHGRVAARWHQDAICPSR